MRELIEALEPASHLDEAVADPIKDWVRKNKSGLADASPVLKVDYGRESTEIDSNVGQKNYFVSVEYEDQTDEYYARGSHGSTRGGPEMGESVGAKKFLRFLDRLLKAALKAKGDTTVRVKRTMVDYGYGMQKDPDGGYDVFVGTKKIGEVWKGMDKQWHSSLYGTGWGSSFRAKKDAVDDLVQGGKGAARKKGRSVSIFE